MGITLRKTMYSAFLMAILLMLCSVQLAKAYVNTEYDFSINFPSGWEQVDSTDVVVLYSDANSSASINVIVEETNLSLADYTSESKDYLENNLDYYELISERSRTIGGLNGYELVYTWTYIDNDYYDLWDKQVFFIKNEKAYIITCGANQSEYSSYLSTFEDSLESFRLTSASPTPTSGTSPTPADSNFGIPNSTLIIIAAVIAAAVVLAIIALLLRRKRQPNQQQFGDTGSGATYPPPPPPP